MDVEQVAGRLTEAQKRALLAFGDDDRGFPGHYAKASELGVSGNTLLSLYGLGGVNENLELGPILVADEFTREGRFWHITADGLAVRAHLQAQPD